MYLYYVILIVMTVIVCIIGSRSEMLRNSIFNTVNFNAIAAKLGVKKPKASFSLGRSQLAFWTVIIVSSFIYLLVFNSSSTSIVVPVLTGVSLALLAISGGTTLIAQAIDSSQKDNNDGTTPPPQQDYPSKNFFTDIISDDKGVSLHRLQNVIWTIVIGATYIAYVSTSKKLPDETIITGTMLGLMGISAGTYLGLKNSENSAVPDNGTPTPSPGTNKNVNTNTGNNSNVSSDTNTDQAADTNATQVTNTNQAPTGNNGGVVSTGQAAAVNGAASNG